MSRGVHSVDSHFERNDMLVATLPLVTCVKFSPVASTTNTTTTTTTINNNTTATATALPTTTTTTNTTTTTTTTQYIRRPLFRCSIPSC